jgi:phage host-nuclease inhibitor protein Gam
MDKKDTTPLVIANVSLLSVPNAIEERFAKFKDRIIKPNSVRDFEVNTDESQAIAESKIKQVNGLKTEIEDVRKELNAPLNHIKNIVQQNAKLYDEDCVMTKSILNKKVTDFKDLKVAQLKAAEETRRAEEEKEVKRKEEILNRINNILSNFTSFLFGGDVLTTKGETIYKDAPETSEDLDEIKKYIKSAFPDLAIFQEFESDMLNHYENLMSDIEAYKMFMDQGQTDAISKLKTKYYVLCNRSEEEAKKVIQKAEKEVDKKLEKELKDASKGFRESLVYDITNMAQIPTRFLMVDPKKINDYIARNRDELKEKAKTERGHEPIPGITFRIKRANVTY